MLSHNKIDVIRFFGDFGYLSSKAVAIVEAIAMVLNMPLLPRWLKIKREEIKHPAVENRTSLLSPIALFFTEM